MSNDNHCYYVSTCGLSFLADYKPIYNGRYHIYYPWLYTDISERHKILFVKISQLFLIIENIEKFKEPVVVITNHDDHSIPWDIDYQKLIHPNILAVFSQNCCIENNTPLNFFPIPIGIDYHTLFWEKGTHLWGKTELTALQQEEILKKCIQNSKSIFDSDPSNIITNFQLAMDSPPRRKFYREKIYELLKDKKWMIFLEQSSREDFWNKISDKVFVLCPPGNGLDTHRTWEVLMLGKIPIIQNLPINSIFEKLPVWIVDDWQKFSLLTQDELKLKHKEFCEKWDTFDFKRLSLEYWKNYIHDTISKLHKQ